MAKSASENSGSNKTQTRTIALAVAAVLISINVLGGFFLLQRRAVTANSSLSRFSHTTPEQADTNRNATIAKAKELRDKWQVWALQHKEPLRAMLASSGENQAAFLAARNELPSVGSSFQANKEGISTADLGTPFQRGSDGGWRPNPDPNVIWFAWHIAPHVPKEVVLKQLATQTERERFNKQQEETLMREKENFSQWHDIEIASGSNEGFDISLWASGRITEKKWSVGHELDDKSHAVTAHRAPTLEILPPYDFLK